MIFLFRNRGRLERSIEFYKYKINIEDKEKREKDGEIQLLSIDDKVS